MEKVIESCGKTCEITKQSMKGDNKVALGLNAHF
jgi:hypothetical protein